MFGLNFSLFKSNTVRGVVVMILSWAFGPNGLIVLLPEKYSALVLALGGLWASIGLRNAISNNGPSVTASESAKANGVTP